MQNNGNSVETDAAIVETTGAVQSFAVVEFFDRLDHLYREQIDARDRELATKDRLIAELEKRAREVEQHAAVLKEYIATLPPDTGFRVEHEKDDRTGKHWWHFWR